MKQTIRTPADIERDIVNEMKRDEKVEELDVRVDVTEDGTVRLTGTVPSFYDGQRAEEDALLIEGVTLVDNQLRVAPPALQADVSDGSIAQTLKEYLEDSVGLDAAKIGVSVKGGIVTLTGEVKAYWEKMLAEELASDVAGVRYVNNELLIVLTERASDEVIAEKIRILFRNARIDPTLIDVEVENGVVTLTGIVRNQGTVSRVRDIVYRITGVTAFNNELSVGSPD